MNDDPAGLLRSVLGEFFESDRRGGHLVLRRGWGFEEAKGGEEGIEDESSSEGSIRKPNLTLQTKITLGIFSRCFDDTNGNASEERSLSS